jgi:hypothetical protein
MRGGGDKMAAGDPQFEWHARDGKPVQAPTDARTYIDISRARLGPAGLVTMVAVPPRGWRVELAEVSIPTVIASARGVRTVPSDRRAELIRAFRAEGLPVEPERPADA